MRTLASLFAQANDDGILIAESCIFVPGRDKTCVGGAFDFLNDDGSRRLLEQAQEMEDVFPFYDLSGQRITAVQSHYRVLTTGCTATFTKPKCQGSCDSCSGKIAKAKCKARQLTCKAKSIEGTILILRCALIRFHPKPYLVSSIQGFPFHLCPIFPKSWGFSVGGTLKSWSSTVSPCVILYETTNYL
jgi:hypothetical protein